MAHGLVTALENLQALDADVNGADAPTLTLAEKAELLKQLDAIAVVLNSIAGTVNDDLAATMDADEVEVPGVGYLVRESKSSKTWRYDGAREAMFEAARREIARRVATNPATGELDQPIMRAATEAFNEAFDAFSFGADPKASFRRRLGLDPTLYREERSTGYRVKIVTPFGEDGGR